MNNIEKLKDLSSKAQANDPHIYSRDFITEDLLQLLTDTLSNQCSITRDDLGYSTFAKYFENELFPNDEIKPLVEKLISKDFLFYKIEHSESKYTIKRSFSLLILAELIWKDAEGNKTIDMNFLSDLTKGLLYYLEIEHDFTGKHKDLGWVHTFAHFGDCISRVISHPNMNKVDIQKSVNAILDFIHIKPNFIFSRGEEFRLSRPLRSAFIKLDSSIINDILDNMIEKDLFSIDHDYGQNFRNTFRSLYLELIWANFQNTKILDKIKNATLLNY